MSDGLEQDLVGIKESSYGTYSLNHQSQGGVGKTHTTVALAEVYSALLRKKVLVIDLDPGKLVMKWKTEQRVIDHIVEVAGTRAKKGEAFR